LIFEGARGGRNGAGLLGSAWDGVDHTKPMGSRLITCVGMLGHRAGLLAGCLVFLRACMRAACDASGICHGEKLADFGPTSRLPRNETFF
jgi:hypothetical protein